MAVAAGRGQVCVGLLTLGNRCGIKNSETPSRLLAKHAAPSHLRGAPVSL